MTTDANEPGNKEDERLTIDDLTPTPIMINPVTLRGLIDRLQKLLPTVSDPDLAIIHTIAELDRIARLFEDAERKRQKIWRTAIAAATKYMPELVEQLKAGANVPEELMEKMVAEVVLPAGDDTPPDPNCMCVRCTAKRKRAMQQASSSRTH